ncbi:LuxR family transcriptional regulator [Mesorhizobium loti]|uniref:LuxR family transcriptional regulator n=1 Tax=Rhizobium loti TaxID=381 RepID=A0A101KXD9_RHILI|nr:LuxR family transcriptional regulator [Mesorhizobium loti]
MKPAKEFAEAEFCRYLDKTHRRAPPQELFDLLAAFARSVNFPWIAYRPLAPNQMAFDPPHNDLETMLNYPNEWQKRYFDMGYYKFDPITKKIRGRFGAIQWKDVYDDTDTTEEERRIFDDAATFGLMAGVTIPLHGPNGKLAMISFAQSSMHNIPKHILTYLELSAFHFRLKTDTHALKDRKDGEYNCLSSREKECVFWVSRGKSSVDIGTILGISENTVDFHVKNVKRKLNCSSRLVAAVKAMKLGIIDI